VVYNNLTNYVLWDWYWTERYLKNVLIEEKLNGIGTQLETSLKNLLCLLAFHCGLAKHAAYIDTELLK
jgi:hypothetical protein